MLLSILSDIKPSLVHVAERENSIVNRLNKTKVEKQVDHEQERIDRIKKENAAKRAAAVEKVRHVFQVQIYSKKNLIIFYYMQKKEDAELAKAREAEKAARSYDLLFNVDEEEAGPRKTGRELEEDFM